MDLHFLDLLVQGSPTEICVPDCSWLTEEEFTECFKNCDTSNLMVLQLDQCGRCMPDYILPFTLARSPKVLPMLSTLSISGACRLSDVGLRQLVSSAPAITSINLNQCSLLTSSSIDMLSDSLGSVLRELYINECQNIDMKHILAALKKFEKLEVLSLADLPSVKGRFLKEFVTARGQTLKQLILTNSRKLSDSSIKVISENCPNLSVLDLANVCKLTDSSLGYLANGCQALEKLIFCRNPFSDEAVAAFVETAGGSLKELSLNNVKKVGHNTALALAKHSDKLQILDISWCREMSNDLLGYIVDNSSSLKVLKVFGCSQVTDVFVKGHSNPNVKILGVKMDPFLGHLSDN
jgi:DNA repair protein RAD7